MAKLYDTPVKAMRKKCLDCCCGKVKEVRLCPAVECALWPYRFGRRPTKAILDTIKEFYSQKVEPA
ncbi:uncharacterized protein METZ01_LOCUS451138 [marine metagenome]|uniref:Uncharacterized protein n=1 Tax=marine metagenome TaxID=408172 RepID=A0A382ZS22_9ZZZZ